MPITEYEAQEIINNFKEEKGYDPLKKPQEGAKLVQYTCEVILSGESFREAAAIYCEEAGWRRPS